MAGSTSHRVERVSSLLRDVIGELVSFELKDPRVFGATVTDVEVSGDLGEAKVFVAGPVDQKRDILRGLQNASGFLRREIGLRVQLRTTPQLKFVFDESLEHGARIDRVLRELGMQGAGPAPIDTDDDPERGGDASG